MNGAVISFPQQALLIPAFLANLHLPQQPSYKSVYQIWNICCKNPRSNLLFILPLSRVWPTKSLGLHRPPPPLFIWFLRIRQPWRRSPQPLGLLRLLRIPPHPPTLFHRLRLSLPNQHIRPYHRLKSPKAPSRWGSIGSSATLWSA